MTTPTKQGPVDVNVRWRPFPEDPPAPIEWGHYERHIVATESRVFECSWLNCGWHERHDGCSDRTYAVRWWAEKPVPPNAKVSGAGTASAGLPG
jgi:hypothetical protein